MVSRWITENRINKYRLYLEKQEKSQLTIDKYIRDICKFRIFLSGNVISRQQVIAYKKYLMSQYKAASVNSMLAALNSYLVWIGLERYKVRVLKIQRRIFRPQEKELTKKEYRRLLMTAKKQKDEKLYLIMQTICVTGMRVSELPFITVEGLKESYIQVHCKNKTRYIWIPATLTRQIMKYIHKKRIGDGPVFLNNKNEPVGRSYVWSQMKIAAKTAGINDKKVYPHNLRHLFARSYYEMSKDIVKLSDILGHSSIETTRIYTMTTGKQHAEDLGRLGLVIEET